jgi:hypothetical protein
MDLSDFGGAKRDESERGWRYPWNNEERSQDFQRL